MEEELLLSFQFQQKFNHSSTFKRGKRIMNFKVENQGQRINMEPTK